MTIDVELVHWLQSEEAAVWLELLTAQPPDDTALLGVLSRLRKHMSPAQASALVTTAQLRRRAEVKFPGRAQGMFFTKEALEQATPYAVARHTAARFRGVEWVADLGCGAGGDALALADEVGQVLAVDRDAVRLALLDANACSWGRRERVHPLQADIMRPAWRVLAAWADPDRRTGPRRLFHPDRLHPPLQQLLALRELTPNLGIKLMPGLPHEAIPAGAEAEWISLQGQLKEAVLWFGELARGRVRRATVLPSGAELVAAGGRAPLSSPGAFLYEPDPAVIRAGAVGDLALELGLWQIDPEIAYLSGDRALATPFARCWRLLDELPFDLKALNRRLRRLQGRVVAVKKRGSPIDPEAFRRRLYRSDEGTELVLVVTRVRSRPWCLICQAGPTGSHSKEAYDDTSPHSG
ncbi:MAG: class I SAM-dependent methyltransferase [Caldilineae bacterium]|nr:MAG: class I SAM-dependent methyltransferase [Caldilineae bacterium]